MRGSRDAEDSDRRTRASVPGGRSRMALPPRRASALYPTGSIAVKSPSPSDAGRKPATAVGIDGPVARKLRTTVCLPRFSFPDRVEVRGAAEYALETPSDWRPLLHRPAHCARVGIEQWPDEAMRPPASLLAFVYAGAELTKLVPQHLFRVARKDPRPFFVLDRVLASRRCHPTDFMRAQFLAWKEKRGFHDKRRGVFVQMDYPPPTFLCPQHASEAGLEASMGWQRAWATYEEYARVRLPYGPNYRDPRRLLDLDVRTAHVRSAKIRRDREGEMPKLTLSSFATAAEIRRGDFLRIREGEATPRDFMNREDRFERWDWRTTALVEFAGLATRRLRRGDDRFSRLVRHAHAFLKTEQPSRDWLRRALHPLKLPPCPRSDSSLPTSASS